MKFARLMVLLLLVIATVITCVACNGGKETTRTKKPGGNGGPSTTVCSKPEDHEVAEWTVDRPATCRVPLREVGVCTKCGAEVERKGDKLDHDWGEPIREESTCLMPGEVYHKCSMCQEEEMIEELPLADHQFTEHTDSTGKFVKYDCSECGTNYIKAKPSSNDLFYWATNEVSYEALGSFNSDFGISLKGLDYYKSSKDSNNTVCGMFADRDNAYMFVEDKNNILKNEDNFVIQFDIMYEKFPEGSKPSTLLCLPINNQSGYLFLLTVNSNGYLGFLDETAYEAPIKEGQLSLNTWHNIAVVVHFEDGYMQADGNYFRIPYDVYLDGKKLALECEITIDGEKQNYTAEHGATADKSITSVSDIESLSVRLFDGGRNVGLSYRVAIDNFRLYSGTTVQPAMRGELDFGAGGKLTVDFPTAIIWE